MKWNKINVDNYEISLTNDPLYLEIDTFTKLDLIVNKGITSKLVIIGNNDYEINIKLKEEASLILNSINKDNNVKANILLNEKANITYNHSVSANKDSVNFFNIKHLSDSSISNLNNNGINNGDNKLFFSIDGVINKKLKNIICNQNSKIINFKNGNSKIIPNLIIDSNDIIANHSAYIGEIGEDELFYMKSRGINENDIKKLIYKAVLLGKMDMDEEKEEFNKKINEWW